MAVAKFRHVAAAGRGGTAWASRAAAAAFIASVLYLVLISGAAAQEDDGFSAVKPLPPEEAQRVEQERKQATETLSRGDLDRARRQFEEMLKALPHDGPAERDAGRAASAAGQFEYAAEALEKAHHFEGHKPDPELHYLRGEALFTLGRDEQAFREHRIAELEIGPNPEERMAKLWLARIYARRGYVVLSDRVYETMQPPPPKFDEEVSLNQADAHLLNKDWEGGARVLHRYLALDPKNVRGRQMLAWALEADGDLDGELAVRRSLVEDHPTAENQRDYGRALERAASYRAASLQYHAALADGGGADNTLVTSYDRMHFRVTPELSGGGWVRSDPQAWDWRVQAGAALPFGIRHQAGLLFWRDTSTDWSANQVVGSNVLRETGSVTGLGGYAMFGRRSGASLLLGGRHPLLHHQRRRLRRRPALRSGPTARLRRPDRARRARLALRPGEPAHRRERAVERRAGDHPRGRHADRRRSDTSTSFRSAASSSSTAAPWSAGSACGRWRTATRRRPPTSC